MSKRKIKVLWVCNIVLPSFSDEFSISKQNYGGWLSGMLKELEKKEDLEIGLCFPIRDNSRMRNGFHNGHSYYSVYAKNDTGDYDGSMEKEFECIIADFNPDILHVWGTEYNHSRAAVEAGKKLQMEKRILVDIQGLVSIYANHYASGIPWEYVIREDSVGNSIKKEIEDFRKRGKNERKIIEEVFFVSGRTDWDKTCVAQINRRSTYLTCHRVLREGFYHTMKRWNIADIDRFSLFVSQATYSVKGLHHLIKALPIIKKDFPGVKVIVAGASPLGIINEHITPYGSYIKELIKQTDTEGIITFTGTINEEQMIDLYVRTHIVVSPSNIENLSNAICEAMFLGTPVISSDVGGIKTILSHEQNGLLYQHDAEYMLAGSICRLFSDDNLAVSISKAAFKSARILHNAYELGERMKDNYLRVLR